jgi:hypothetical protein
MKQIFENIVSAGAAISLVVLVLAIFHETAFFFVIGYQFEALLSPTDYAFTALGWLPAVIFFWLLGAAGIALLERKALVLAVKADLNLDVAVPNRNVAGLTSEEAAVLVAFIRRRHRFIYWCLWSLLAVLVLDLIIVDFARFSWLFSASGIIVALLFLYGDRVNIPVQFSIVFSITLFFLVSAIHWGLREGFWALEVDKPSYIFVLKGDATERNWPIVRNLTRGVLVHDILRGRVSFYKWEDISSMSKRENPPRWGMPICSLSRIPNCPPAPPAAP